MFVSGVDRATEVSPGIFLGDDKEQTFELWLALATKLDEARAGIMRSTGQLIRIMRPPRDLLDRAINELLSVEDVSAVWAEQISDAATISCDDGNAQRNSLDKDKRLRLMFVEGREQEDVDVLVELPYIIAAESTKIGELTLQFTDCLAQ